MRMRSKLLAFGLAAALWSGMAPARTVAQASVSAQCWATLAGNCTLLRFLISAGLNPVALNSFKVNVAPSANWFFTGGPNGSYTAEDGFSFGVPYIGSTLISNGGLELFISFLSGPAYELFPFSNGYIEVAATGSTVAGFNYTLEDPDQAVTLGAASINPVPPGAATVTPEPFTVVLLGSGLAGIAAAKRKRRRDSETAI